MLKPDLVSYLQGGTTAVGLLATTDIRLRNQGVKAIALALSEATNDILEANTLDLEASRELSNIDVISDWLKLTPERLKLAIDIIVRISESSWVERIGANFGGIDQRSVSHQLRPRGLIAFISEGFPELVAITAGFTLSTGNALLLYGKPLAYQVNRAISEAISRGLSSVNLPTDAVQLLPPLPQLSLTEILSQDEYINLILTYGRPHFGQQISQQTTIPVLRSVMGNCYLYWSNTVNPELVTQIIYDSHQTIPDAINAIEKVLITPEQSSTNLIKLYKNLHDRGFQLLGNSQLVQEFPDYLQLTQDWKWNQPYLRKTVAFKMVENIQEAIAWINNHSSGHADCIVTNLYTESRQFAKALNSAYIYINTSPRFYRHPPGTDRVYLGMANQSDQHRGLISFESFMTNQEVIYGE